MLIIYDYFIHNPQTKIINIVSRYLEEDRSTVEYHTNNKNVFNGFVCKSKEDRGINILRFRMRLAGVLEEFINAHSTDVTGNTCVQNLSIHSEYNISGTSTFIVTAKFPLQSNLSKLVEIIPTNAILY
jgi:hypothetical protein